MAQPFERLPSSQSRSGPIRVTGLICSAVRAYLPRHHRALLPVFAHLFFASLSKPVIYHRPVTVDTFRQEIVDALRMYDRYIICIDKTPEDFEICLSSLLAKAIKAYENRGPQLRHGIALDRYITVILSQNENSKPLCGIYFNLHSPYQKQPGPRASKSIPEAIGGTAES